MLIPILIVVPKISLKIIKACLLITRMTLLVLLLLQTLLIKILAFYY